MRVYEISGSVIGGAQMFVAADDAERLAAAGERLVYAAEIAAKLLALCGHERGIMQDELRAAIEAWKEAK